MNLHTRHNTDCRIIYRQGNKGLAMFGGRRAWLRWVTHWEIMDSHSTNWIVAEEQADWMTSRYLLWVTK